MISCDLCRRSFERKFSLDRHKQNIHHLQHIQYHCKECNLSFSRVDNLRRHERSHQAQGLKYCNLCSRGFRSDYILQHKTSCQRKTAKRGVQTVLKVRALPFQGQEGQLAEPAVDQALLRKFETRVGKKGSKPTAGSPRIQLGKADLCLMIRDIIADDDVEALLNCWRRHEFDGLSHSQIDQLFRSYGYISTTMLMHACSLPSPKITRHLLTIPLNIDKKDYNGNTALHRACRGGYLVTVTMLLDAGADHGLQARDGSTPLTLAVRTGNKHCVQALLSAGAEVQQGQGNNVLSGLQLACDLNLPEIVQLLLEASANVNDSAGNSREQWTPLWLALQNGSVHLLELLLKAGARIDQISVKSRKWIYGLVASPSVIPQHEAFLESQDKVKLLSWYTRSAEIEDLHCDESTNHEVKRLTQSVVDLLVSGDAAGVVDLMGSGPCGRPYLQEVERYYRALYHEDILTRSVRQGNLAVAELLLERDYDPSTIDSKGYSSLHYASRENSVAAVKLLLKHGVNVDQVCAGETALCSAVRKKNTSVAMLLLNLGAALDGCDAKLLVDMGGAVNANPPYALETALLHSTSRVVEILLDAGARPELVRESTVILLRQNARGGGCYPVDQARQKLQLLVERGQYNVSAVDGSLQDDNYAWQMVLPDF